MKNIDSNTFKSLINNASIALMGIPVKESINYMPYGLKYAICYMIKLWNYLIMAGIKK